MSDVFRSLKAIFKTALTWGIGLGVFSGTLIGLYVLFVPRPEDVSLAGRAGQALFAGVGMGLRFAFAGFVLGTFFATLLRLSFRGKRIADLHPGKFALIGAVVGGLGIPLFYQFLNVISGGPIPWSELSTDVIWAAIVGGAGAAGTVWMARRAAALPEGEEHGQLGEPSPFGEGAEVPEGERVGERRTTS